MGCTSRENDMRQNHARLNYEVTETEGNTINWVTMRRAIGDYENKLDMIYNLRKTVCCVILSDGEGKTRSHFNGVVSLYDVFRV